MRSESQRIAQAERKALFQHRVCGDERVDLLRPDRDHLGVGPGGRLAEGGEHVLRLLLALLIRRDAAVLVGLERGVGVEPRRALVGVRLRLERCPHRRRVPAEGAFLRFQPRYELQDRLPLGLPRGVARIEVGKIPGGSRCCGFGEGHCRNASGQRCSRCSGTR